MTPKNPFPRPTLPDSQETRSDRETKSTNVFGKATRVDGQPAYDQYPAEGAILSNRYELLQKIGQGGMGQVYKALDIDASNIKSQPVFRAIKILSPALIGNQREIRRLQTEAMNAQELTHENIIRVHHFDKDSEHIYLIMEWLDGKSFNDLLTPPNHHGIAFSVLKPYLPAIAKALDYAHRKNIIHRDIKPSNLFLTNDNRVVVIDFGVSYAINESQSRFSETSGTPSYRPPEALVGGHQSGASDDVYALAVTLYELLTGDLPYKGELVSSRNANSPKPKQPDSLSQTQWQRLFNAFYFEPSKRPQSVGEFIAELCASENSLPVEQKATGEAKPSIEVKSPAQTTVNDSSIEKIWAWADEFQIPDEAIPRDKTKLLTLRELVISDIGLTYLPPEIGRLSQLQELWIDFNQLRSLPATIGQLNQLHYLDVGINKLSRLPPEIGQLNQLRELNVCGNKLSRLPSEIGQLSQLQHLDVHRNNLSSLPPEIGQLSQLQYLDVDDNTLKHLPESLTHLTSLKTLLLRRNTNWLGFGLKLSTAQEAFIKTIETVYR